MSSDLHILGERAVTVNKTGKQDKQIDYFDAWGLPPPILKLIDEASTTEAKLEVYRQAIKYPDHLTRLAEWLASADADGYTVRVEIW